MAAVYQIKRTDGVQTITIQPGTLNGPGGVLSDTDLLLYGQGTIAWGAGIDQNLLRIIENFACPEHSTLAGQPADETDLGISGAGINNPIVGQQWFNTDTGKITVLTEVSPSTFEWVSISSVEAEATPPTNPILGTLWYDPGVPQLKVWDGAAFTSVADRYLELAGGTMTGNIAMGSNEVIGLPATPSATGAASKEYVDAEITTLSNQATIDFVNVTGDTMSGNLEITNNTDPTLTLNSLSDANSYVVLQDTGENRADFVLDLPSDDVKLRRLNGGVTVINEIVFKATHIETTSTANGKIRTPATVGGDNTSTLTTKGYVDTEISTAVANSATIYASLASGNVAGDIAVTGGKIYIALADSDWKQIWPAVYT